MKKFETLLVAVILVIAFSLRLYKVDNPVADWHSWRQADTAAVARNFAKEDFNILLPKSDSLTAMNEYGLANPNRYFINEFPIYNVIVGVVYKVFGVEESLARLVSVVFATIGTLFLYLFSKDLFGRKVALLASFFYATNPYNIYYGRVIMPDPAFICFSIMSVYFFFKWVNSKKLLYCLISAVIFGLAILTKPYAVFLLIPFSYWLIVKWGKELFSQKSYIFFLFVGLAPFLLWRVYASYYPEGTFATTWLYNAGGIRFTGAFFRWLIFERMVKLIFASGSFVLFVLGIAKSYTTKSGSFVFVWLLSVLLYMVIFAKGNVTHDYYQLPLMAPGAVLVSLGFFSLVNLHRNLPAKILNLSLALALFLITSAFGWYEVKGFYNINHPEIVEAGKRAAAILPHDATVIAPYDHDPTFLYQTQRHGYTKLDRPLESFVDSGTKYLVSNAPYEQSVQKLIMDCKVLERSESFAIVELSKQCIGKQ